MPHQLPHWHHPSVGIVKPSNQSVSQVKPKQSWTEFDFSVKTAGVVYVGGLIFSEPVDPNAATIAAIHKAEFMATTMDGPFDHTNLFVELCPHEDA